MTVTDAPPEASPEATDAPARPETGGLAAVLGTGDHKTVGRLWIGGSLLFLLVAALSGGMIGFERVDATVADILGSDAVQLLAGYRISTVFLVALPLFLGVATFITPLQVGSPSLAFPRAAAAAVWTWLLGSGLLLAAIAFEGGPGGEEADMIDLWLVSWGLVLLGLALGTICVVTTVLALRTPNMTLTETPFFSWSMFVAGTIWLLTLPVLGVSLLLAYIDHRYGQLLFGAPDALWVHVAWVFDQPTVYMAAIPALGLLAEIAPVAAGRAPRQRGAQQTAIAVFGILSFGAWAQPALSTEFADTALYVGMSFAILIPLIGVVGGVADVVRRGRFRATGTFMAAGAALDLLLIAAILGAIASIESLDLLGTTWQTAQSELVWVAAVVGGFAALAWWSPKIWGRPVPRGYTSAVAWTLTIGAILVAIGLAIAGARDQPVAVFAFDPRSGVEASNVVAAIGAALIVLGAVIAAMAVVGSMMGRSDPALDPDDPWGGQTLEWSTSSPPPPENFTEAVPVVTSGTPGFEDPGDDADEEAG